MHLEGFVRWCGHMSMIFGREYLRALMGFVCQSGFCFVGASVCLSLCVLEMTAARPHGEMRRRLCTEILAAATAISLSLGVSLVCT